MEVEVISEKENPLLERRDVMVRIKHTGAKTPLRSEIRKLLTAKLSADDDKLILGSLNQSFGVAESLAKVKIYKTKERAVQIESPHLIRKNTTEKAKPAVEKPAEEKPAKVKEEKAKEVEAEVKTPEPAEEPKVEAEKKEKAPKKAEVKEEAPKKTEKKAKKEPKTEKTAKAKKPKKKAEKSKAKEE